MRHSISRTIVTLSSMALVLTTLATWRSDERAAAVWVAHGNAATLVGGEDGALLRHISAGRLEAVAVDPESGRLWVAASEQLLAFDDGLDLPTLSIDLGAFLAGSTHLVADAESGAVWLARGRRLQSFGQGGQLFAGVVLATEAEGLALDDAGRLWVLYANAVELRDGVSGTVKRRIPVAEKATAITTSGRSAWLATSDGIVRLRADGSVARKVGVLPSVGPVDALARDAVTGTWWIASGNVVTRIDAAGRVVDRIPFTSPARALTLVPDPRRLRAPTPIQPTESSHSSTDPILETATLDVIADTYLQNGPPNQNHGSEPILKVRSGGKTRPLARFALEATAARIETLHSATLELFVEHNGQNWGPGREVGVHRILAAWTEMGATWRCADDADPSNGQADCEPQWHGGDFDPLATATETFTNDLLGWTSFDVTADVEAMLAGTENQGWLVAKQGPAKNGLVHFTAREGDTTRAARLVLVFEPVDDVAPTIEIVSPVDGTVLATATPELVLAWNDEGSGVDPATLDVEIDGIATAATCTSDEAGATCSFDEPLAEGAVTIATTVADRRGNRSDPATISITIDTIAPAITIASPAEGTLTNQPTITVDGSVSEPADLTVNGVAVPLGAGNSFTASVSLAEGVNSVQLVATDAAGNAGSASITVILDTVAPLGVDVTLVVVSEPVAGIAMIEGAAGAAEADARVTIVNARTGDTVTVDAGTDGSFSASLMAVAGDVLELVVTDAAGNASAGVDVTVPGIIDPTLPPDPSTVAPPLDRTVVTDFFDATAFLYSGPAPLQRDADPSAFERRRVAVIHGEVLDRDGLPLAGVAISARDQPEVGTAISRADGAFDLALNGGGPVVLDYRKDGFLPVQRIVETPWRDYVRAEDVVMLRPDAQVTRIEADFPTLQVARGTAATDADGTRTATVLFPTGTSAEMVLVDGTRQALGVLDVRATEYTLGDDGPEAMPGPLPPSIGYTYAVELSADQALMAGAERVDFSRPVVFYLENFLGFPTGGHVPTASYDRSDAAWIGAPNGRVVEVLGLDGGGRATLDVDGSGTPADAAALAELGVDDEERATLASLYPPGTSLWRVPMSHFTPWDCNWPFAPPFDAIYPPFDPRNSNTNDPNDPSDPDFDPDDPDDPDDAEEEDDPCSQPGNSVLDCENQILLESVGLTGTGHVLTYASDRVPGRGPAYTIRTTVSGSEVPASLLRIELYIHIAGEWTQETFPPAPDQSFTMVWDGLDRYGRQPQGAVPVTIFKDYVYPAVYQEPADFAQSWARFPEGPFNQAVTIRGRDEITLRTTQTDDVGNFAPIARGIWDARGIGLAGWSLDVHHVYDPNRRVLYPGTGGIESARRVPPVLRRLAGTDTPGFLGDGGPAVEAELQSPWGVIAAPDGGILVADTANHRVRRIEPDGSIATIAGSGRECSVDDGGELDFPATIAGRVWHDVDRDGADPFFAEPSFDGVTVRLAGDTDGNGTFDLFLGQTTGSGIGFYIFGQLPAGTYRITVDVATLPSGIDMPTYDLDGIATPHVATLGVAPSGFVPNVDFGYTDSLAGAATPFGAVRLDGAQIRAQRLADAAASAKVSQPDCGAGSPAVDVDLGEPNGLALLPDGRLLVAATGAGCVLRLETDGTLEVVAGLCAPPDAGTPPPPSCTECPATEGRLDRPFALAATAEGGFYVSELGRIRYVDSEGLIHDVVRSNPGPDPGDGGPALDAWVQFPAALAVGADGSLFVADIGQDRVRRIDVGGTIETVAGTGVEGFQGDGGAATGARLRDPSGLVLRGDGSLFIADAGNQRIRRVAPDGTIITVAGGDVTGATREGAPAFGQALLSPAGLAWHPGHGLVVAESEGHGVWRTDLALPGFSEDDLVVADRRADQAFVFDSRGKHLRTVHTLTGEDLFRFHYDTEGRLAEVEDGDGLRTRIERAGDVPSRIVGPFGQAHDLELDNGGYLSRVVNPAGDARSFTYDDLGLLERWTDWKDQATTALYDVSGRLREERSAAGGVHRFVRASDPLLGRYRVDRTTGEGATTLYTVIHGESGEIIRGRFYPDRTSARTEQRRDGSFTRTTSRGTTIEAHIEPDARFGLQGPMAGSMTVDMGAGRQLALERSREVQLTDPIDPFSIATSTNRLSIAGRTYRTEFDGAARRFTDTSPEGRNRIAEVDAQGRLLKAFRPGIEPIVVTYTPSGEIDTAGIGEGVDARISTYEYDDFRRVVSTTDPASRTIGFTYDDANRLTRTTLPDDEAVAFDYDANGDLVALTPPGRPAYGFTYTPVGLVATTTLPDAGAGVATETRTYDTDRRITGVNRPDGRSVGFVYNTRRQLDRVTVPHGDVVYGYDLVSGQLDRITAPDGGTLDFAYQGTLTREVTWGGDVAGTVGFDYDDTLRLAEVTVDGANPIAYLYDDDSLLTQVGDLAIARDPQIGLRTGTAIGLVTTATTYTSFSEPEVVSVAVGGVEHFRERYTFDIRGWITDLVRTIGIDTVAWHYEYDLRGRLTGVDRDGAPFARYTYDSNGNRLTADDTFGSVTASHDVRDRLLEQGGVTYTYDDAGTLSSKSANGTTVAHDYDVFGNLRRVERSDGLVVEYLIDGAQRRIGKRVGGMVVERFLYQDSLNPVLHIAADGTRTRFVYGTRLNVPDYFVRDGRTYRIVADHLGSPRLVIDTADGTIAQRLDYDAFGRVIFDSNPGFQPFGFAGGLFDHHTGLVRFGARDYDPELGRFTAPDPQGFAGGDTNLYAYALGNPVNLIDPSGEIAFLPVLGAGWAIFELGSTIYDGFNAVMTFINPCSDWGDYLLAGGTVLAGIYALGPGSAYGNAAENVLSASTPIGGRGRHLQIAVPEGRTALNAPTSINGRPFSGHALDRMQGQGIPPSAVDNTIQNGRSQAGRVPGTRVHYDPANDITVVTNTNSGQVVTTFYGGG